MERSRAKALVDACTTELNERHARYGKALREKRPERELSLLRGSITGGEWELARAKEALRDSTPD